MSSGEWPFEWSWDHPERTTLQQLSELAQLIARGARTEVFLPQLLELFSGISGTFGAAIARYARGRWKILATDEITGDEEIELPDPCLLSSATWRPIPPTGFWHYVPLKFRGDVLGLLVHRQPTLPLSREQESHVDILSTFAAAAIFAEDVALRIAVFFLLP